MLINCKTKKNRDILNNHLLNHNIYVKANFSKPFEKFILITVGPKKLMDSFIDCIKSLIKNPVFDLWKLQLPEVLDL